MAPPPLPGCEPLLPLAQEPSLTPPSPPSPLCPLTPLPTVNQPEWCLVDAACHAYSMISVPLYDTLGPDTGSAEPLVLGHRHGGRPGCGGALKGRPGCELWHATRSRGRPALPAALLACKSTVHLQPRAAPSTQLDTDTSNFKLTLQPALPSRTAAAVKYICNHAELAAVACSVAVLGKMLEVLHECPTVRLLVRRAGWLVL